MEPQKPSVPNGGTVISTVVRHDALSNERRPETAADFVAAQAKAMVEARYVMAVRQPRDLADVRARLLHACRHPAFAAEAIYRKPVGKGIEGLSIRFVEAAIQMLGNISADCFTVYDDSEKRIVRVLVQDLERNVPYSRDVTIDKTVERRDPKGETPISKRINSQGQITYRIAATDDDTFNKEMALVSKTIRSLGLRLIPADLKGEAESIIYATLNMQNAQDPDAERKKVADAFAGLNVMPSDLGEYLGHSLDKSVAKEVIELRALFTAIRDGEATWAEALEHRQNQRRETKPEAEASAVPMVKPNTTEDLTAKLKAEGKKAPKKTIDIQVETTEPPATDPPEPGSDG